LALLPLGKNKGKKAEDAPKENEAQKDQVAGEEKQQSDKSPARPKPGVADYIAGEASAFIRNLKPYLVQDLIGGSVPHIPGTEEEAVWNAASQACGTEKVHYTYTVEEGRCYYLACPSTALASNPDSWCPLAAALPGNSEFWDKQTVYLYEQEGLASALRWDPETGRMQVYLGASRTLLPRIQSMDANFVTINPEVAKIVPWRNRQLRTEKLSRATAKILLYFGLALNVVIVLFLATQHIMTIYVNRDLQTVKQSTDKASNDLMLNAYNALQSDTIRHMVRIQELLDALNKIDGTLLRYEINKNQVEWEALVPPSFSDCSGALKGCKKSNEIEKDGRVKITGRK
jgi:hypothetical protein